MLSSQDLVYKAKSRPERASYKISVETNVSGQPMINCWAEWMGGFEIEHRLHLNEPGDVDFAAHWAIVNHATWEFLGWHVPIHSLDEIRKIARPDSTYSAAAFAAARYEWEGWLVRRHDLGDDLGTAWVIHDGKNTPHRIIRHDPRIDRAYSERIAYVDAPKLRDLPIMELLDCVVDGERIHWAGKPATSL